MPPPFRFKTKQEARAEEFSALVEEAWAGYVQESAGGTAGAVDVPATEVPQQQGGQEQPLQRQEEEEKEEGAGKAQADAESLRRELEDEFNRLQQEAARAPSPASSEYDNLLDEVVIRASKGTGVPSGPAAAGTKPGYRIRYRDPEVNPFWAIVRPDYTPRDFAVDALEMLVASGAEPG